jgi:drug/metabolite transporter (DMT)-like permease
VIYHQHKTTATPLRWSAIGTKLRATAAIAHILLKEHLNAVQIIGSLIILAGVVFLREYEGWLTGYNARSPLVPESAALTVL